MLYGRLLPLGSTQRPIPIEPQTAADFDLLWTTLRDRYAYFDSKATGWDCVRARYRPTAERTQSVRELIGSLEGVLDELYDPHTHLNSNLRNSYWLDPPQIYAVWKGSDAVITEVKTATPAEAAGVRAGMRITAINGVGVRAAVNARLPKCLRRPDPAAADWALVSAVAGRRDEPAVTLSVLDTATGGKRTISFENAPAPSNQPAVQVRILPDCVGYIAVRTFAEESVVAAINDGLDRVRRCGALILDVRNNNGGDTAVTRPVLGRFIHERKPYALMARRKGGQLSERWTEFVDPVGPWTYDGRVIVLVDHWTMSAAEGFAMAFRTMHRGLVAGTGMAGLGAGVGYFDLPNSHLRVQYSAEPVYDLMRGAALI